MRNYHHSLKLLHNIHQGICDQFIHLLFGRIHIHPQVCFSTGKATNLLHHCYQAILLYLFIFWVAMNTSITSDYHKLLRNPDPTIQRGLPVLGKRQDEGYWYKLPILNCDLFTILGQQDITAPLEFVFRVTGNVSGAEYVDQFGNLCCTGTKSTTAGDGRLAQEGENTQIRE